MCSQDPGTLLVLRKDVTSRDHIGQISDIDIRTVLLVIDGSEIEQIDLIGLFQSLLELFSEIQDSGSTVRFEDRNDLFIRETLA